MWPKVKKVRGNKKGIDVIWEYTTKRITISQEPDNGRPFEQVQEVEE